MEIDYFDLPGNFTLIFFFFPCGKQLSPSFSNYALAKKKAFIFSTTRMGSRYGLNIQAEPTDDLCGNSDRIMRRSLNFLGHMHKSLSKTEAITEKQRKRRDKEST